LSGDVLTQSLPNPHAVFAGGLYLLNAAFIQCAHLPAPAFTKPLSWLVGEE